MMKMMMVVVVVVMVMIRWGDDDDDDGGDDDGDGDGDVSLSPSPFISPSLCPISLLCWRYTHRHVFVNSSPRPNRVLAIHHRIHSRRHHYNPTAIGITVINGS